MADVVGNVLKVNFVQGPDYLQDVAVYATEAANSASASASSATASANSASQANTYKNQAQTYASNAASSANQASTYATNAANSATASANSASASANSASASANSATQAQGYRNEAKSYADETEAHYNQFYIDLTDIKNFTNNGFNRLDGDILSINEWIELHNSAFSLYAVGIFDNDGTAILDNDDVWFGSESYLPITDPSLSQEGVPADAYAVGVQVEKLNRLDALIESWQDNFVTTVAPVTDNDGNPVLDNDDEELTNGKIQLLTDETLTLQGVPADAYAVGVALQEIRDLIASYHP
jgi:hypothetical protein